MIVSGGLRSSLINVFNPVSSLYNDGSKAVFTSGDAMSNSYYVLPIMTGDILVDNGDIKMIVDKSIMVSAIGNGVILETMPRECNPRAKFIAVSPTFT